MVFRNLKTLQFLTVISNKCGIFDEFACIHGLDLHYLHSFLKKTEISRVVFGMPFSTILLLLISLVSSNTS